MIPFLKSYPLVSNLTNIWKTLHNQLLSHGAGRLMKIRQKFLICYFSSVQFSHWVMSDSLWPHGLQHARLPCPSTTPGTYSNSCPSSRWCHPTITSSVIPFPSCLQSFSSSGSLQISQFFTSGGQSIGVSASASILPMNIRDWFPLGWTGWISLQSKGLSCLLQHHDGGVQGLGEEMVSEHLNVVKMVNCMLHTS